MKVKYKNLAAEMARYNLEPMDLAKAMHYTRQTVYCKLRGEVDFTLENMLAIQSLLDGYAKKNGGKPYTLDYLFDDD